MASNIQKGNTAEIQAMNILINQGWNVIRSPRTMKCIGPGKFISQSCDYYNLFDLIAKKNVRGNRITFWIQVKSTGPHVSTAKPEIAEFHENYMSGYEVSEIWQKVPFKGFIRYSYNPINKLWDKQTLNLKGDACEFNKNVNKTKSKLSNKQNNKN